MLAETDSCIAIIAIALQACRKWKNVLLFSCEKLNLKLKTILKC